MFSSFKLTTNPNEVIDLSEISNDSKVLLHDYLAKENEWGILQDRYFVLYDSGLLSYYEKG